MSPRMMIPALLLLATASPAFAQEGASAPSPGDSVAQPAPKKKGMFGKLKSIAGNKTVQSVAKVAACTMVPGGQFVAAGIDAASNAAEGDAAGTAVGAAGAATGSACAGALGGGAVGAAGMAAPGMGAVGGVGSVAGMAGSAAAIAGAMTAGTGMSPDDDPAPAGLSAKDEKRLRSMLKKQGMTQEQIDQAVATYKQQGQPQVPSMPAPSVAAATPPAAATNSGAQPVGLPDDYDAQLKAGKLVLIDLPWKGSTADLIAGTEDGVRITFVKIVESLNGAQGTYRVDVYVTESDKGVAQARASAIVVFLTSAGLPAEEKLAGKTTAAPKSKQARVELVRN